MPTYAEFQGTPEYPSRTAGASVEYLLLNAADPADVVIGKVRSMNSNEPYESLPVEEAGNDGVDEIVQGRHGPGRFTLSGFFSPQFNDRTPTRQSYKDKRYVILTRIAEDFAGAGTVLDAWDGCVIDNVSQDGDARGLKTFSLGIMFTRKYNGAEWAELTGRNNTT